MGRDAVAEGWRQSAGGWVANEAIFDAVFAPVTAALGERAEWGPEQKWLDVGCGSGTMLHEGVRAGAAMVGVDVSPAMVAAARARVPAASVVEGDAQVADVRGADFDGVISRFGVMFFSEPVAAFANLRSAVVPDGRMVFACWRTREENPVFTLGTDILTDRLPEPLPTPEHGAPGPTALADPDRLQGVLEAGGWHGVSIEPLDFICDYGMDGSDGVEERLAVILATSTGAAARARLEPSMSGPTWSALLDDVRAELRRHLIDGVLRCPGAAWLVTAHAGRRTSVDGGESRGRLP